MEVLIHTNYCISKTNGDQIETESMWISHEKIPDDM
jgi:hypothetical protein